MDISSLSDKEVIELYPAILGELKKRGIIRTNNLIGELGEYFVADIYKRTPSLPQLQLNTLRLYQPRAVLRQDPALQLWHSKLIVVSIKIIHLHSQ
jgi:hypothetical protein